MIMTNTITILKIVRRVILGKISIATSILSRTTQKIETTREDGGRKCRKSDSGRTIRNGKEGKN